MYCPYCNFQVADNTTVCPNCGKKFYISTNEHRCAHCGYAGMLERKENKIKIVDWIILIGFFPLSIMYYFIIVKNRPVIVKYKCPKCKHVEEVKD